MPPATWWKKPRRSIGGAAPNARVPSSAIAHPSYRVSVIATPARSPADQRPGYRRGPCQGGELVLPGPRPQPASLPDYAGEWQARLVTQRITFEAVAPSPLPACHITTLSAGLWQENPFGGRRIRTYVNSIRTYVKKSGFPAKALSGGPTKRLPSAARARQRGGADERIPRRRGGARRQPPEDGDRGLHPLGDWSAPAASLRAVGRCRVRRRPARPAAAVRRSPVRRGPARPGAAGQAPAAPVRLRPAGRHLHRHLGAAGRVPGRGAGGADALRRGGARGLRGAQR